MKEINFGVHWLNFTVHDSKEAGFLIYDLLFKSTFGALEDIGHGGRGFKEIHRGLLEFKIYTTPAYKTEVEYFHIEIPGQACELISWQYFQGLESLLVSNFHNRYSYTRLDIAFDNCPFTPYQIEDAVREERVRSLAKRDSLEIHNSPYALKDNGEQGTYTVNFGSRYSERMIRVYDKRGFTRLEMELKDTRADLVAKELFQAEDISEWFSLMIGHLRDFVDFDTLWWNDFIGSIGRAWKTVSMPKDVEMEKIIDWCKRQVAPAISVLVDEKPDEFIKIIDQGRRRRIPKYNLLLSPENRKRFTRIKERQEVNSKPKGE